MRRSVHLPTAWLISLGLAAASLAPNAKELSTKGVLLDRVVAVVNDGVVLESELDLETREIENRLQTQHVALPPEAVLRQQVLDRLVGEEIQQQHADRAGIKVTDEQVNAALEDIAKRQNLTLDQLPEKLAADGIDYPQYRLELKREIARQILRQRDVVQRIVITPRELDQYLDHQKKTATASNEYNVAHILIAVPQDAKPAQLAQANTLAHEIDDRAHKGEEFGALAVAYSQSESALEGGSLGWRKGTERRAADAERLSYRETAGPACRRRPADRAAGAPAPHTPQAHRNRGRRHRGAEAVALARTDPLGQGGIRSARQDLFTGQRLGGRRR
jgi:peptidyl-prolyl cis-trans isomerase SurA